MIMFEELATAEDRKIFHSSFHSSARRIPSVLGPPYELTYYGIVSVIFLEQRDMQRLGKMA